MSACLFCRIVQRQIPSEIVAEDTDVVAFKDINPQAPTHLLIVPKVHIPVLSELTDVSAQVMAKVVVVANQLARQHGLVDRGYRLVVNCGPEAGQSVAHVHVHLLGGRPMRWPPG